MLALPKPRVDNRLLEGFRAWLQGRVRRDTAEYYAGVVERASGRPARASTSRHGASTYIIYSV